MNRHFFEVDMAGGVTGGVKLVFWATHLFSQVFLLCCVAQLDNTGHSLTDKLLSYPIYNYMYKQQQICMHKNDIHENTELSVDMT